MRSRTLAIVVSCLVLGLAGAATLSAQAQGSNPILEAIQALQVTLNDVATAVDHIDTTVTDEGNELFTPALFALLPDVSTCTVTNVSGQAHSITVELINAGTGSIITSATATVSPNRLIGVVQPVVVTQPATRAFCKITVADGVKSDVRGAIALTIGPIATGSDRNVVAAQ